MRIRTIKPEFWRSDDITQLSREDRLLFIGLWSYVDDNGVGIDDYRQIAADLFALEDDQNEVRAYVREGLATLSRVSLVTRYKVGGKSYLFINSWDRHQRIDRPSKARFPRPPEDWKPSTSENVAENKSLDEGSRESRDSLDAGTGEQGNRGTGEKNLSSAKPPREDVEHLCLHLANKVAENTGRRPNVTKRWHDSARLLLDKDLEGEPDPLGLAIRLADWATADEFWRSNILGMPKFREKFDQLRLRARQQWEQTHRRGQPPRRTTDDKVAAVGPLVEKVFGLNGSPSPRPELQAINGGKNW